jgi:hypothetical protein
MNPRAPCDGECGREGVGAGAWGRQEAVPLQRTWARLAKMMARSFTPSSSLASAAEYSLAAMKKTRGYRYRGGGGKTGGGGEEGGWWLDGPRWKRLRQEQARVLLPKTPSLPQDAAHKAGVHNRYMHATLHLHPRNRGTGGGLQARRGVWGRDLGAGTPLSPRRGPRTARHNTTHGWQAHAVTKATAIAPNS